MSPENGCSYKEFELPHGWVRTMVKHSLLVKHHQYQRPATEVLFTNLTIDEIDRNVANKVSLLKPEDAWVDAEHQILRLYEKKLNFPISNGVKIKSLAVGITDSNYVEYFGIAGVNRNGERQVAVIRLDTDGKILDSNNKGWGKEAFKAKKIQRDFGFLAKSLKPQAAESLTRQLLKISKSTF